MPASDRDTTLPSVAAALPGEAEHQQLLLTIVFHPDTRRIGAAAVLGSPDQGDSVVVGRCGPAFAVSGEPSGLPLDDPHVSRQALTLQWRDGDLLLRRGPDSSRCQCAGGELQDEILLGAEALCAGVPLLLAHSVVLLLRLGELPSLEEGGSEDELRGSGPYMAQLRQQVGLAARADQDVLLRGATGTGKELVARAIHRQSERSSGPLISVNMAAVPEELAAAALFGVERGAYTGAERKREGYFQQASGGTLFLDEVGDTPSAVQPQLLRAVQQREVQRVGGAVEHVELRIVSATDALVDDVQCGFRAALRHRLAALEIVLLPLAEHPEDIGELLLHYLEQALSSMGKGRLLPAVDSAPREVAAWAGLFYRALGYGWPGNVRELVNYCRQIALASNEGLQVPGHIAAALVTGVVGLEQPQDVRSSARRIDDVDDEELARTLQDSGHEVAAAARRLGVSRQALYRRMAASEHFRLAADIPGEELQRVLAATGGSLGAAAEQLQVSRAALQSRLRAMNSLGG